MKQQLKLWSYFCLLQPLLLKLAHVVLTATSNSTERDNFSALHVTELLLCRVQA